ncbi:hypothetical protein NYZ99_19355 [Maribacter litopenaei]|uniref:Uncharacterized protein n=1 Tax=Maribacter litopenaei TaxID=2976127 RepID=A0ABY5Y9E4_9FLAO|nr:hypothetical protein [Maribacter litopenaei]UWX54869.1 hypothetical protein NYZ99_19355 [Maribacter litopenaei]
MKKSTIVVSTLTITFLLLASKTVAQCEVLKSEIKEVKEFMTNINQLTDSLSAPAELAGYEASFKKAKLNALEVEHFLGKALDQAFEAVSLAEESQYNSGLCGLKEVISNSIEAESYSIDARDLAEQAYSNAKKAVKANNLGNLQYHIRIAHRLAGELREASYSAAYHAEMAHYNCVHGPEHGLGSDK